VSGCFPGVSLFPIRYEDEGEGHLGGHEEAKGDAEDAIIRVPSSFSGASGWVRRVVSAGLELRTNRHRTAEDGAGIPRRAAQSARDRSRSPARIFLLPDLMHKRLSNLIADRSPGQAALAVGACLFGWMVALPFTEPEPVDFLYMLNGLLIGTALIVAGFAAAPRLRPLPAKQGAERARAALLAVGSGAAFGLLNLAVNLGTAAVHPELERLLRERFVTISPWTSVFAAPILEEIAYRLVFLSVLAWIVARFVKEQRTVFLIAMGATAFVFGAMHLDRPMPDQASLALLYGTVIVLKIGDSAFCSAGFSGAAGYRTPCSPTPPPTAPTSWLRP
jgi:membrane protease YdiL (CAAX protease family)